MISSERSINLLLTFGAIVFVLVFVAFAGLGWKLFQKSMHRTPHIEQGTMGQEGIACGGPERLPCVPGFVCDTDDDEVYGTCVKDERELFPLGAEGVMCNNSKGCQPGLTCNAIGGASGVCIKP